MERTKLGESSLSVSQIVLGTMNFSPEWPADTLVSTYIAAGGNLLDSAHCYGFWTPYGAGASERTSANCIRELDAVGDCAIATKGGHPSVEEYRSTSSYLAPYRVRADIDDSLARLGRGSIDLYWLHRDDESTPVSEIIDFLNEEIAADRIRHIGASNWSAERIAEANAYAKQRGKRGFVASQPAFSLGVLNEELGGMRSLSRTEEIAWYIETQFPVMAYSPTAQGFFATAGASGESYHNETSFRRLERAETLAKKRGVETNDIAIAYLLSQDFPVYPIIGTGNVEHLKRALAACDLQLTTDEREWLIS